LRRPSWFGSSSREGNEESFYQLLKFREPFEVSFQKIVLIFLKRDFYLEKERECLGSV